MYTNLLFCNQILLEKQIEDWDSNIVQAPEIKQQYDH